METKRAFTHIFKTKSLDYNVILTTLNNSTPSGEAASRLMESEGTMIQDMH